MFRGPQINFYVENVDASAGFYRELFGFVETFRTPEHGVAEHVELRLDGFTLGLAAFESVRGVHGLAIAAGSPQAELVVWTDDVDAALADLTAKGARVLSPPHNFLASLRAAWVADLDGNPVQIVMRRGTPAGT